MLHERFGPKGASRAASATLAGLLTFWVNGCGGSSAVAQQNRTFYSFESGVDETARRQAEWRYPPLDAAGHSPVLSYQGYAVLNGRVRLSRPNDWVLRGASDEPGKRYIQYLSPRAFLVSLYERPDVYDTPWPQVLKRYEAEAHDTKAELLTRRVPVASFGSQGRAFVVRRHVPGARGAYETLSHEVVARGERRVVLVQVLPQGGSLTPIWGELQRTLETLEVD
jgi:hypothetical protein